MNLNYLKVRQIRHFVTFALFQSTKTGPLNYGHKK